MYLKKLPVALVLNFRWRINPARTASLLSSCQRKDWNESKMTKRMIEFRESIVVVLLVREQPRYKVIQNITQYTNLQLFFSETFISLVLQNSICIPFAKQKSSGFRLISFWFITIYFSMIRFGCSLTKRYTAKSAKSAKGKRNDKHAAEKRCGQTIRETDYFSTFS